jgi:hypothetical protein
MAGLFAGLVFAGTALHTYFRKNRNREPARALLHRRG